MVCLGNICRSPLAEGIMQSKIDTHQLNWEVDSAGTSSWHIGELPDNRSINTAGDHGLDITNQRARQLKNEDFLKFDLILAMDSSNYNDIRKLAENEAQKEKVHMIMNFVKPGYNQVVPDPYWDDNGFETVYQMLDLACDKIVEKYKNDLKP